MYASPSWQELGRPTPAGWVWTLSAFVDANLPLPSFLGGECKTDGAGASTVEDDKDM